MYSVSGMKCSGCVDAVRAAVKQLPEVIEAQIHLSSPQAIISMKEDVDVEKLQQVLLLKGDYHIYEIEEARGEQKPAKKRQKKLKEVWSLFQHKKECCK